MSIETKDKQEPRNRRLHRFAEVETLAKRLYMGVEYVDNYETGHRETRTIDAYRAFHRAEAFFAERDRRKGRGA